MQRKTEIARISYIFCCFRVKISHKKHCNEIEKVEKKLKPEYFPPAGDPPPAAPAIAAAALKRFPVNDLPWEGLKKKKRTCPLFWKHGKKLSFGQVEKYYGKTAFPLLGQLL